MNKQNVEIARLSEMTPGNEADLFVLMSEKETHTTKDGKPFFKIAFRDNHREIRMPIWNDSQHFEDCKENWQPGGFYKIRAVMRMTRFGPQLDLRRIRPATDSDRPDGFDPNLCRPSSRFEPEAMYAEILDIAQKHIGPGKLQQLITRIFKDHRKSLLEGAAAKYHHHTFFGGLLEHTLSVTQIAVFLADHYVHLFPELKDSFSKPLVVAGAILHDIGKIREQECDFGGSKYTVEGSLIGHVVLGRDFVREYGRIVELDESLRIHLEHIVLSHQRLPEWDSPRKPMSLEAVLVHHADSCDALFGSYLNVMQQDDSEGPITSKKNIMGYALFRGGPFSHENHK